MRLRAVAHDVLTRPAALVRDRGGAVAVEFAFVAPILVLVAIGARDFGTAYVESIRLEAAAKAATRTVLYSPAAWSDSTTLEREAMETWAGDDLTYAQIANLPITATAESFCGCVDGTTLACTDTCSDGGEPGQYVRVTVDGTTTTLFRWPGTSGREVAISRSSLVRAQ